MEVKKWKVNANIGGKKYTNVKEKMVEETIASAVGPYTVFEAFDLYIEDMKQKIESGESDLSKQTLKNYENIKNHHLGSIMLVPIQMLTESDIQYAFKEELDKGISVKTIRNYRGLLKKVLNKYRPDFVWNVEI